MSVEFNEPNYAAPPRAPRKKKKRFTDVQLIVLSLAALAISGWLLVTQILPKPAPPFNPGPNYPWDNRLPRGFTLIELLVVISIIAVLSTIVLSALDSAEAKGRDATRVAQVRQIMNALTLYANDHAGALPSMSIACIGVGDGNTCWGDRVVPGSTALITALAPYAGTLPSDPSPTRGWGDHYVYLNTTVVYQCSGGTNITGKFIAYDPETRPAGGGATCPTGFVACCPTAGYLCNNAGGYFCAVQF